jgi:hypothetical protein
VYDLSFVKWHAFLIKKKNTNGEREAKLQRRVMIDEHEQMMMSTDVPVIQPPGNGRKERRNEE